MEASIIPVDTTVLIVDDNEFLCEAIEEALAEEGYKVLTAHTGAQALECIQMARLDMAFVDLKLPDVTGVDVLKTLLEKQPEAIGIIITAYPEGELAAQAREIGPFIVLTKPFRLHELADILFFSVGIPSSTRLKLLIVDDDPLGRRLLSKILKRRFGFEILEAADGNEALDLAHSERPDLILMDLGLPHMSGLEATQRLKGDPSLSGIPVIAMTAHDTQADEKAALAYGCSGYLTKPIDISHLIRELRSSLGA